MRILACLLLAGLAGCASEGESGGNDARSAEAPARIQTATPVGLYEAGPATARSQICLLDEGDDYRFGLVLRGADSLSCSGAGSATVSGDRLLFTMAGDQPCTLEARVVGARLELVAPAPASCAYYCAPGVALAGTFDKVGGERSDALRARDLVGDTLCG
jgi:hypothetical protein